MNPTENQLSFSIADLQTVTKIIEICSQRGAFQASELSTVGGVYERLTAFLTAGEQALTQAQDQTADGELTNSTTEVSND